LRSVGQRLLALPGERFGRDSQFSLTFELSAQSPNLLFEREVVWHVVLPFD
jgi:hypothetical protein